MSLLAAQGIKAYAAQARNEILGGAPVEGVKPAAEAGGFGAELDKLLTQAVETGKTSEAKAAEVVAGKGDLVDVVTAISAAEVTLETVVAVRDKVISAYNEIMRMPI